ncbi:DMT family transporter [Dasania marina]|mgnify:CR=1 FL=1|uniref:DMT family transporter n=1 Tax=Dasania marina TaxID=471499 RepID=UPI0030DC2D0F
MKYLSVVTLAILVLIAGNFVMSLSDVAVKLLAGCVSAFQYIFIRQLCCLLLLLPFWFRCSTSQRTLKHGAVTTLRAHLVLVGSGCAMVALTHLPLATANAVFYAAPLIMLPLSIWIMKEKVPLAHTLATALGFIGVLIVLRPSQFHWAALFALGTAFTWALFNVLVKKLPVDQPVSITLIWTNLLGLPLAGVLAVIFWQPMSALELGLIAISALFSLLYHGTCVFSYHRAPTSQLAIAEYSGLIFVSLLGMIYFEEYLDTLSLVGIALIVLPIALQSLGKLR